MAKPDFGSFAELPRQSIDEIVKECGCLARLHPQDEDNDELWSWYFVLFAAALAAIYETLNHSQVNEFVFIAFLIALVRCVAVKVNISKKFDRYIRARDQLERRIGRKLLFEIDR
jgi:hypothetical protein